MDPRFVHDVLLRKSPLDRKYGVPRTQKPVLMKDLDLPQLARYTTAPRQQVVFWLTVAGGGLQGSLRYVPAQGLRLACYLSLCV